MSTWRNVSATEIECVDHGQRFRVGSACPTCPVSGTEIERAEPDTLPTPTAYELRINEVTQLRQGFRAEREAIKARLWDEADTADAGELVPLLKLIADLISAQSAELSEQRRDLVAAMPVADMRDARKRLDALEKAARAAERAQRGGGARRAHASADDGN